MVDPEQECVDFLKQSTLYDKPHQPGTNGRSPNYSYRLPIELSLLSCYSRLRQTKGDSEK